MNWRLKGDSSETKLRQLRMQTSSTYADEAWSDDEIEHVSTSQNRRSLEDRFGKTFIRNVENRRCRPPAPKYDEWGDLIDEEEEEILYLGGDDGRSNLLKAAENGEIYLVRNLLKAGADHRGYTSDGSDALHRAAAKGHTGIVKVLIEEGRMDPNRKNRKGRTCLHNAIAHKRINCIKVIGNPMNFFDWNITDSQGLTVRELALKSEHDAVIDAVEKAIEKTEMMFGSIDAAHIRLAMERNHKRLDKYKGEASLYSKRMTSVDDSECVSDNISDHFRRSSRSIASAKSGKSCGCNCKCNDSIRSFDAKIPAILPETYQRYGEEEYC